MFHPFKVFGVALKPDGKLKVISSVSLTFWFLVPSSHAIVELKNENGLIIK